MKCDGPIPLTWSLLQFILLQNIIHMHESLFSAYDPNLRDWCCDLSLG